MNEELVEKRLSDLEGKIDRVLEIVSQTQLQEYRIKALETLIKDVNTRLSVLEKQAGNMALKIVAFVGGGIGTLLLGFIAVKVGLK